MFYFKSVFKLNMLNTAGLSVVDPKLAFLCLQFSSLALKHLNYVRIPRLEGISAKCVWNQNYKLDLFWVLIVAYFWYSELVGILQPCRLGRQH